MHTTAMVLLLSLLAVVLLFSVAIAQDKPRARDLGIPFDGKPGKWNAITDVAGVEVGHETLISGKGKFLAFSTANAGAARKEGTVTLAMLPNERMNALFDATGQATEEAILNAMVAAETMIGVNDRKVIALPHDRVKAILKRHNRLAATEK